MSLTQTITPVASATEVFGGIISVDRLFTKKVLFTFVQNVDKPIDITIYGSNYNDPTMTESVLETTISAVPAGNVNPQTRGYQTDSIYDKYRVGIESDGAPTGTVVVTFKTEAKIVM